MKEERSKYYYVYYIDLDKSGTPIIPFLERKTLILAKNKIHAKILFKSIRDIDDFEVIYQIIKANKVKKKYALSI